MRRWLRDLFRIRWEERGSGRWRACRSCEGSGAVDLPTGKPVRPGEQNANAIGCRSCNGMGRRWIPGE